MSEARKLVKYPKKKQVSTKKDAILEPTRTSIYDVLLKNLKIANRIIYVHRLIYIGHHSFEYEDGIANLMDKNVKETNTGYYTEPLTGILLYYDNYFCHIVEASEGVLNKHLDLLFNDEEFKNLDNIKVLTVVHHIKRRFLDRWINYYGHPPVRVEEIDPQSDLENSIRYVKNCGEKLYNFANELLADLEKPKGSDAPVPRIGVSMASETMPRMTRASLGAELKKRDAYVEHLPEVKLLDFLVNCQYLKSLKDYYKSYGHIKEPSNFYNKGWPTPSTTIPYNVFDKPYDPIEDLPKQQAAVQESRFDDMFDVMSVISGTE